MTIDQGAGAATDDRSNSDLTASSIVAAARWLAGSTYRRHPIRMLFIVLGQLIGAVGTAVGTIAVLFYIRAAIGDGTLGRVDIQIESAAETGTTSIFLVSVVAVILVAVTSSWWSEKAITDLARRHATSVRAMILALVDDPLSSNWEDAAGFSRPRVETQQVLVSRIRSMTVALTDVLALVPAFAVLVCAVSVAILIDPLAALLLLPFITIFGLISERLNRRVRSLTADYEGNQEQTRAEVAEQLDDLFAERTTHDQLSLSKVAADDALFHERSLVSTKLRLLGIVNGAILFALTAAFFIIFRGVDNLSIEGIIAYIYSVRFATRSLEQIIKAMAQVSRRFQDITSVSEFIKVLDGQRLKNSEALRKASLVPEHLTITGRDSASTISRGKPIIVVSDSRVSEDHARDLLRILGAASDQPETDLAEIARFADVEAGPAKDDAADEALVSVIVSEDPSHHHMYDSRSFTFVMHHKPRVLLGRKTRDVANEFGPAFVISNGEITWTGSIDAAREADAHIRELATTARRNGSPKKRAVQRAGAFDRPLASTAATDLLERAPLLSRSTIFTTVHKGASTFISDELGRYLKRTDLYKDLRPVGALRLKGQEIANMGPWPERGLVGVRVYPAELVQLLRDNTEFPDFAEAAAFVFVQRDPRDTAVSLFYSKAFSHTPNVLNKERFVEERERLQAMSPLDGVREVTKSTAIGEFRRLHNLHRTHGGLMTRYEDLVTDPDEWFHSVGEHIGWPEEFTLKVAEKFAGSFAPPTAENPMKHKRRISPGNWSEVFDEDLLEHFDAEVGELMRANGYL